MSESRAGRDRPSGDACGQSECPIENDNPPQLLEMDIAPTASASRQGSIAFDGDGFSRITINQERVRYDEILSFSSLSGGHASDNASFGDQTKGSGFLDGDLPEFLLPPRVEGSPLSTNPEMRPSSGTNPPVAANSSAIVHHVPQGVTEPSCSSRTPPVLTRGDTIPPAGFLEDLGFSGDTEGGGGLVEKPRTFLDRNSSQNSNFSGNGTGLGSSLSSSSSSHLSNHSSANNSSTSSSSGSSSKGDSHDSPESSPEDASSSLNADDKSSPSSQSSAKNEESSSNTSGSSSHGSPVHEKTSAPTMMRNSTLPRGSTGSPHTDTLPRGSRASTYETARGTQVTLDEGHRTTSQNKDLLQPRANEFQDAETKQVEALVSQIDIEAMRLRSLESFLNSNRSQISSATSSNEETSEETFIHENSTARGGSSLDGGDRCSIGDRLMILTTEERRLKGARVTTQGRSTPPGQPHSAGKRMGNPTSVGTVSDVQTNGGFSSLLKRNTPKEDVNHVLAWDGTKESVKSRSCIDETRNVSQVKRSRIENLPSCVIFARCSGADNLRVETDTFAITVTDPQKHSHFFSKSTLDFRIRGHLHDDMLDLRFDFSIRRRIADFKWLQKALLDVLPGYFIPPLFFLDIGTDKLSKSGGTRGATQGPMEDSELLNDAERLRNQQCEMELWLNRCICRPHIAFCPLFKAWLGIHCEGQGIVFRTRSSMYNVDATPSNRSESGLSFLSSSLSFTGMLQRKSKKKSLGSTVIDEKEQTRQFDIGFLDGAYLSKEALNPEKICILIAALSIFSGVENLFPEHFDTGNIRAFLATVWEEKLDHDIFSDKWMTNSLQKLAARLKDVESIWRNFEKLFILENTAHQHAKVLQKSLTVGDNWGNRTLLNGIRAASMILPMNNSVSGDRLTAEKKFDADWFTKTQSGGSPNYENGPVSARSSDKQDKESLDRKESSKGVLFKEEKGRNTTKPKRSMRDTTMLMNDADGWIPSASKSVGCGFAPSLLGMLTTDTNSFKKTRAIYSIILSTCAREAQDIRAAVKLLKGLSNSDQHIKYMRRQLQEARERRLDIQTSENGLLWDRLFKGTSKAQQLILENKTISTLKNKIRWSMALARCSRVIALSEIKCLRQDHRQKWENAQREFISRLSSVESNVSIPMFDGESMRSSVASLND